MSAENSGETPPQPKPDDENLSWLDYSQSLSVARSDFLQASIDASKHGITQERVNAIAQHATVAAKCFKDMASLLLTDESIPSRERLEILSFYHNSENQIRAGVFNGLLEADVIQPVEVEHVIDECIGDSWEGEELVIQLGREQKAFIRNLEKDIQLFVEVLQEKQALMAEVSGEEVPSEAEYELTLADKLKIEAIVAGEAIAKTAVGTAIGILVADHVRRNYMTRSPIARKRKLFRKLLDL